MSDDSRTEIDTGALPEKDAESQESVGRFRTLRHLIDYVTGKDKWNLADIDDAGLADIQPFPFLALVGQREMKLALLIALVNPAVGGVLLIGPRGTGKTTAVRGLVDLLPQVPRSLCYYGCMPEDIEAGGIDAVCPECAKKYAEGEPLTKLDRVRLVELPLNARLDDVIGGIDERAANQDRIKVRRGILAQADRNILFIDEVNLLANDIIDAILDAAAQGRYTIRRGPVASTYRARFVLVGSMNPEEGRLRPQIMDRFGLRVVVRRLDDTDERLEVYRRVQAYSKNPRKVSMDFAEENLLAMEEIQSIRDNLHQVVLPDAVARQGVQLVQKLKFDSARSEITLFEAGRAYAALDGRTEVTLEDIFEVSPMVFRMRRSKFMEDFIDHQDIEEQELAELVRHAQEEMKYGNE
jgi:magnesium chelatase subunit I